MENDKHIPLKDLVKTLDQGVKSMNQGKASSEEFNDFLQLPEKSTSDLLFCDIKHLKHLLLRRKT